MGRRRARRYIPPQPYPYQPVAPDPAAIEKAVEAALGKVLAAPPGARVTPVSHNYLNQIAARPRAGLQSYQPLPRPASNGAFGPGVPLLAAPIDDPQASGRPAPRRFEFDTGWNINLTTSGKFVPFQMLRDLAAPGGSGVIRQCIEVRKKALLGLDWAFTIDSTRAARMAEAAGTTRTAVTADLRQKYGDLIDQLQRWWAKPDWRNNMTMEKWIGAVMEDQLVLDAVAIYPHLNLGGNLDTLEVVDGSTIKPLLDGRGATPQPPMVAYQQILYGFVRGDFQAANDDRVSADLASARLGPVNPLISTDTLLYEVRNCRSNSPYGLGPTEQAVVHADLWLKRMAWLKAEYDESVTPEMLVKADQEYSPEHLRAYESHFNDELAGDTAKRHRAKFMPAGFEYEFAPGIDSKFSSDLDLHIVRLQCANFGVMPSSLGFVPQSGLGGAGHQEGEKDNELRQGTKPDAKWFAGLVNEISRTYFGMPDEVVFQFLGLGDDEDEKTEHDIMSSALSGGMMTLNETRDAKNLPRYAFPLADQPFIAGPGGTPTYLDPDVREELAERFTPPALAPGAPGQPADDGQPPKPGQPKELEAAPPKPGQPPAAGQGDAKGNAPPPPAGAQKRSEAQKFVAFVRKRAKTGSWRDFQFEAYDGDTAAAANLLAADGDLDAAKALLAMAD